MADEYADEVFAEESQGAAAESQQADNTPAATAKPAAQQEASQPALDAQQSTASATPAAAAVSAAPSSQHVGVAGKYVAPGGRNSVSPSRRATSPSKQGSEANVGNLTFSRPPNTNKAKPYNRADFSHSAVQLLKIGHDNQLLIKRLTEISTGASPLAKQLATEQHRAKEASSAVNRRKSAATIAQENHALYQRLVALRPSKEISRETLDKQHQADLKYRANCSTFKTGTPGARAASPEPAAAEA